MRVRAKFGVPTAVIALLVIGISGACADSATKVSSGEMEAADSTQFYMVGGTGIYCVREPCPWRGVVPAGPDGRPRGDVMLWAGDTPPILAAEPGARNRILAAWEDLDCLLIEGRFADKMLEVSRIVGPC